MKSQNKYLKFGLGTLGSAVILCIMLYGYSISSKESLFRLSELLLVQKLDSEVIVNCSRITAGNASEIAKVRSMKRWSMAPADNHLLRKTSNCTWIKRYFNNGFYVTDLEKSFPIAFSFLIHNKPSQVLRLLRLLYRPHNQYCIAPDKKSGKTFIGIFHNLAECLNNILVVSELREVRWGHKSIMETQMQCYRDLLNLRQKQARSQQWKYVINLCGKELPLNTNHEIVTKLMQRNGSSVVNAHKMGHDAFELVRLRNQQIPFSIPLYKSMTYMALSHTFVNYLFTNSRAITLYNFFRTCKVPEEHYYATVYMLPHVPGGYNPDVKGHQLRVDNYFWRTNEYLKTNPRQCSGIIIHEICVVDFGDLLRILASTRNGKDALFHNKYFLEYDHVIMDCMEEQIQARNRKEHQEETKTILGS